MGGNAATQLVPLLRALTGLELPVRLRAWDGSEAGSAKPTTTIVLHSRRALRRLLWRPNELGLTRAYVAGDLAIEGDLFALLALPDTMAAGVDRPELRLRRRSMLATALRLGAAGPPPRPPAEESRLRGQRHTRRRDRAAVSHHYDVGNDFYRLVLGSSMTYSCGYWESSDGSLAQAQAAKHELVSRKLGLAPGMRLLDVGCGWGSMAIHAAQEHGVQAVGVTISQAQAELARKRVAEAGLSGRVEIRLQDYRDVADGPYDAISSIGMAEHVGAVRLPEYAATLAGLLAPRGRLLNHAISKSLRPGGDPRPSFLDRYVFPDGELLPVGTTVSALESAGLEVRDVESLREHYALTLRQWVANLEAGWDQVVRLSSVGRARVWRLYMAGAAVAFEWNRIGVHQVLAVKSAPDSGLPLTRRGWLGAGSSEPLS
jgi:cyclopropane-fatty-acyl-phospholipid synthase